MATATRSVSSTTGTHRSFSPSAFVSSPTRASVKTWLFTIARSRALDRWRSRHSIEQRFSAAPDESLDRASAGDGGQESAALRDYVSRCLEKLSEAEQAVLRLAYFDGYTQEEVTARLGEPLGTVKSRTRSGLAKLKALAGEGGPAVADDRISPRPSLLATGFATWCDALEAEL